MERAAAPVLGTLTGFLLAERAGVPTWLFVVIISMSMLFGILASMGREGERRVTPKQAVFNGGALWVLTCAITFKMDFGIEVSAIFALAMGLLGAQALEVVERFGIGLLDWLLRRLVDPARHPVTRKELDERIGDERNRSQAAMSEQAMKGRRDDGPA